MSFDSFETSIETSRPREIFDITHASTTYQIASGDRDISYDGKLYVASPIARSDLQVDMLTAAVDVVLILPVTHALVARYFAQLSPPQSISVTIRRLQIEDNSIETILSDAQVTSLSIEGANAKFALPSRIKRALDRRIPSVLVDSRCTAILYDPWCGVDADAFTVASEVTFIDGRTVHVNFIDSKPDQWFQFGALRVGGPGGELQTIWSQVGLVIELQAPIPDMHFGDAVELLAGCAHDLSAEGCPKFNNVLNFVGLPNRPTRNPFFPTGIGVGETS